MKNKYKDIKATAAELISNCKPILLEFRNAEGISLGTLDIKDGQLVFEGKAAESAQEFFKLIERQWRQSAGKRNS